MRGKEKGEGRREKDEKWFKVPVGPRMEDLVRRMSILLSTEAVMGRSVCVSAPGQACWCV